MRPGKKRFAGRQNSMRMDKVKKVAFYTLGCKLNFSETSTLARRFEEGGFRRAVRGERADICIVNTCSVTDHADKKCRNVIRKVIREHPGAIVAVTGCYAQLKAAEIAAIEGVDLVVGNRDKGSVYDRVIALAGKGKPLVHTCEAGELTNFFAAFSSGDRTRAFLKVQDGCDYRCSYCTIPLARGGSRNLPVAELVGEARQIAARGQREIVLTGVNIGDFGRTTGESFYDLIRALEGVEGIDRYRISSIEPNLLTDEILDFVTASKKFQPHFHIPLQSGSDRILGLMRRRYNTERFAARVAGVRERLPDAFIGIDVIVGFPGETEGEFRRTYDFLESVAPAYLHVFPYSERDRTPAVSFPDKVPPREAAARAAALGDLCRRLHRSFCGRFVGREEEVLVEGTRRGGLMFGYTGHYVRVEMPYRRELVGRIVQARLTGLREDGTADAVGVEK